MKIERQGHNECMLAGIAALADTPLDEVRRTALKFAYPFRTWSDLLHYGLDCGPGYEFAWTVIQRTLEHHGLPLALLTPPRHSTMTRLNVIDMVEHDDRVAECEDLPKQGRGAIHLFHPLSLQRHLVVFEDGRVYDPNWPEDAGLPLALVLLRYFPIQIEAIKVLR